MMDDIQRPWWQRAVIYQIYPRSFQDTDGDGVGDLEGIIGRVGYLAWLGVDAVWIAPFYPSPMADGGYDVANYVDVDPQFGTLEDFDRLVAALHARNIRIILDFVPNHTSVEHPWFKESRASRDNPKRDWYVWRDAQPGGGPPNNWDCFVGGSAWERDAATDQYYYHSYLSEQPDLNWRNDEVRAAMYDVLRFWLARGVDGFRVDVIWRLIEDAGFRDDPLNPDYRPGDAPYLRLLQVYSADQPETIDATIEMRKVLQEFPGDRLLIGEVYLPLQRLMAYYGPDLTGAQLPFNFSLMWVDWNADAISKLISDYEAALPPGGWPSWVLGNHDQMRIASRRGPAQARVAMVLLMTLRGTPAIYYGDELGLENVPIPQAQQRDRFGIIAPGSGAGRDGERTPMPWDRTSNAGFTSATPWLPLGKDHPAMSVAVQRQDPKSMLALTHALLTLRRQEPALALGDWAPLATTGDVLVYTRTCSDRRFVVALNLDSTPKVIQLDETSQGTIALSSSAERSGEPVHRRLELNSDEALIIRVTPASRVS